MRRPVKVLLLSGATIALAALASACGTEHIGVASSDPTYHGAVLFSQRCSGCHTLSYAATHGSAANVRTREYSDGPNFNVRCERPITRVIYAIENGGFSGAVMPQNVVVGKDATDVAAFVSKYAGRQAAKSPGVTDCQSQPIGSLPSTTTTATTPTASTATSAPVSTVTTARGRRHSSPSPARRRANARRNSKHAHR